MLTNVYNIKTTVGKRIEADLATIETEINGMLSTSYSLGWLPNGGTSDMPFSRLVWPQKGGRHNRQTPLTVAVDVLTKAEAGQRGQSRLNDLICENILEKLGISGSKAIDYTLIPLKNYLPSAASPTATPYFIRIECPNGFELRGDPDPNVTFYQAILKISLRK